MAQNLPINFNIPGENAIKSYDYFDFAEGTGIITLYAGAVNNSGGISYKLDRNIFECWHAQNRQGNYYSGRGTRFTSTGGTDMNVDFDMSAFNSPATLKGNLIANIPFGNASTTSNYTGTITATLNVYRVDLSATENLIVSGSSGALIWANAESTDEGMIAFSVEVPQTNFKIGEKLRLNVVITTVNTTGEGGFIIGHQPNGDPIPSATGASDPKHSAKIEGTSTMKFLVPFKIEN